MTRFYRDGHWRTSQSGHLHWVEGHWVDRDTWDPHQIERREWFNGTGWSRRRLDDGIPNARCPKCRASVWFYRSSNGGCAYFDDLGWPWPKHPCMDSRSVNHRTAAWQAAFTFREAFRISEEDAPLNHVRMAFAAWQSARLANRARYWDWSIERAKEAVADALEDMLKIGRTLNSTRKKRERWSLARERLSELEVAKADALSHESRLLEAYLTRLNEIETKWEEDRTLSGSAKPGPRPA